MTYSINGATPVRYPCEWSDLHPRSFTAHGTYSVIVTATDSAGNTATAPSFSVTIDKTVP